MSGPPPPPPPGSPRIAPRSILTPIAPLKPPGDQQGSGVAKPRSPAPKVQADSYGQASASSSQSPTPRTNQVRKRGSTDFKTGVQKKAQSRQNAATASGLQQPLASQPIDISGLTLSRPADDTVAVRQDQKPRGPGAEESAGSTDPSLWTTGKFAFGVVDGAVTDLGQGLGLPMKPYETQDPAVRAGQVAGHVVSMAAGVAGFAGGATVASGAAASAVPLALTPGGQLPAAADVVVAGAAAVGAAASALWAVTGANNLGKDINTLFAKSPNGPARKAVQGQYVNPLSNQVVKTDKTLAADYIVPQKEIKATPGFGKLTEEQKSQVLNMPDNLQGLPQTFNSSKGAKTAGGWTNYKGQPLNQDYIDRAKKLQEQIRTKISSMIDGFNQPQSGSP